MRFRSAAALMNKIPYYAFDLRKAAVMAIRALRAERADGRTITSVFLNF